MTPTPPPTQDKTPLAMLIRLTDAVRRLNALQHSGTPLSDTDWAELYQLQNAAFGVIAQAHPTPSSPEQAAP